MILQDLKQRLVKISEMPKSDYAQVSEKIEEYWDLCQDLIHLAEAYREVGTEGKLKPDILPGRLEAELATDLDAEALYKREGNKMSPYWQHNKPLKCPEHKVPMGWLGGVYWVCFKCKKYAIKVQIKNEKTKNLQ